MHSSGLKYIITGIPGSGKTTLVNALQKQGHAVIHEVSRSVIRNEQYEQRDGVPWQNIERFTALVFKETQRRLQENKAAVFCDRGLIDNIAYLEAACKNVPNYLKLFPFEQFYHKCVFFAPPWEAIYVNDPQRPEAFHKQQKLNQTLINVYSDKGFELIPLPLSSIQKRVDFILTKITSTSQIDNS